MKHIFLKAAKYFTVIVLVSKVFLAAFDALLLAVCPKKATKKKQTQLIWISGLEYNKNKTVLQTEYKLLGPTT